MFSTDRIRLRKMVKEDSEVYHTWRNNEQVMMSTSLVMDHYSIEETRDFVTEVILNSSSSKSYIIEEKADGKPIGVTSLIHMDYKNRHAECVIDIGDTSYWGQGYATEALKLLLSYAFSELNMHRISLRVFSFNDKAIKLYNKLGFRHEGTSRESLFRQSRWFDIIHMGMLQEEYKATDWGSKNLVF
ncbi:GNAT family N-acetyltransferase [Salipaludibacillus agaradhaerens]|nr:GNAT family protein [Salipaludibacillus agaradhaerens]